MLLRLVAFLCFLTAAYARYPRPLADVPILTPEAKKINLKQYRGKVLVLVLFSTSCRECVNTITLLSKIQNDYGPQGLQVMGAAISRNAAYLVTPFNDRYRPSFPIGYLSEEGAMKIGDFTRDTHPFVPIVMFVDHKGTVQMQLFGDDNVFKQKQEEKTFRSMSESLLKQSHPEPPAKKTAAK
jgi:peroxiredoxin